LKPRAAGGGAGRKFHAFSGPYRNAIILFADAAIATVLSRFAFTKTRSLAVAAGYGALAIGLPYGAATYASPESSAWALMALCVCGLGVASYRRARNNRLSPGIE
jgi:hypothetical protein